MTQYKYYSRIFQSILLLFFVFNLSLAQEKTKQKPKLELFAAASTFENNMVFTIGEPCVQSFYNNQVFLQEGFLQNVTRSVTINESEPPPNPEPIIHSATIYPNPTDGYLTIELSADSEPLFAEYVIINNQGQKCAEGTLTSKKNNLDLHYLPNGAYVIRVFSFSQQFNFISKLIKL